MGKAVLPGRHSESFAPIDDRELQAAVARPARVAAAGHRPALEYEFTA